MINLKDISLQTQLNLNTLKRVCFLAKMSQLKADTSFVKAPYEGKASGFDNVLEELQSQIKMKGGDFGFKLCFPVVPFPRDASGIPILPPEYQIRDPVQIFGPDNYTPRIHPLTRSQMKGVKNRNLLLIEITSKIRRNRIWFNKRKVCNIYT